MKPLGTSLLLDTNFKEREFKNLSNQGNILRHLKKKKIKTNAKSHDKMSLKITRRFVLMIFPIASVSTMALHTPFSGNPGPFLRW